jgi:hypothetical protein
MPTAPVSATLNTPTFWLIQLRSGTALTQGTKS